MKKLMTVLASTAAALFAFGAGADLTTTGSSVEGSAYEVGQNLVSTTTDPDADEVQRQYWYIATADGGDNGVVVSNYEASATTTPIATRPEKFKEVTNSKFLALDTSSPLYRTALPNTQNPSEFSGATIGTDGIYLDTLVKFTAADDVFGADALAAGDKIAISYVEREDDDTTPEVNEALTNFVIRAGYIGQSEVIATNYLAAVPAGFNKDDWHRLTVRVIADVDDGDHVGFIVYLDGDTSKALAYNKTVSAGFGQVEGIAADYYNTDVHALYPSAIQSGGTKTTISAAAFSGTGAIDDIVFTTEKPSFIQEAQMVTVKWDAGFKTVKINGTAVADITAGSVGDVLLTGTTVSIEYELKDGYEAGTFVGTWASDDEESPFEGSFINVKAGDTLELKSMQPKFDVGGVRYESLEDALDAAIDAGTAQSPATLKLLANCAECITLLSEGYVIIDLAGHDIQGGDDESFSINCKDGANVVVTNSIPSTGAVKLSLFEDAAVAMNVKGDATRVSVYDTKFEGSIKVDGADETALLKIFSGTFYDDSTEGDVEGFKYTKYIQNSAKVTYLGSYYFQVGEGSEQPTTYALTIPAVKIAEETVATATVTAGEGTISDLSAIPAGTVVTVTWTAEDGYKITAGATEEITMSENKTAATPTVQVITYATLTITPVNNCTIVVSNATEEVASGAKFDVAANVQLTVYRTPAEGFKLAADCLAEEMITMDQDRMVTASVVQDGGKTYPSYIGTDTEKKDKYDAWATYAEISASDFPDAQGTNEEAYLLNCKPNEVTAAKAAFKFTAFDPKNPKDVKNVSTGYNERTWNGEVVIKQYSDVGCKAESTTGTFFRAVLQ